MNSGKKLLCYLRKEEINISELARILEINIFLFRLKLFGIIEFNSNEIYMLGNTLGIFIIASIFFTNDVDYKSPYNENKYNVGHKSTFK